MSTPHDPGLCARLILEAREDDAQLSALEGASRAPWRAVRATGRAFSPTLCHYVTCIPTDHACWAGDDMVAWSRLGIWTSEGVTEQAFAEGIARTRNNLTLMADQLEAACTAIEADAAQAVRTVHHYQEVCAELAASRNELLAENVRLRALLDRQDRKSP